MYRKTPFYRYMLVSTEGRLHQHYGIVRLRDPAARAKLTQGLVSLRFDNTQAKESVSAWIHTQQVAWPLWEVELDMRTGSYAPSLNYARSKLFPFFPTLCNALDNYCPDSYPEMLSFCAVHFPRNWVLYGRDDQRGDTWEPMPSSGFPREFSPDDTTRRRFTLQPQPTPLALLTTDLQLI